MKRLARLVLVSCPLLLLWSPAAAQPKIGVHAGAGIATLGGSDSGDVTARNGVVLGAAATVPLSRTLGVRVGLGYTEKGAVLEAGELDVTFALDYLEVPVLLAFAVPADGPVAPRLFLGPSLAVRSGCALEGASSGVTATFACDTADFPVRRVDLGLMGGAGLEVATSGPVAITLEVFHTLGFVTIDGSEPSEDVKNRAWALVAGVELPLR